MAGEYSYPLLVELEKTNITKIKIKLVKYFQSKKSNGGDCEVDYENGSGTAVLRFRTEEDQKNVLKKEAHQIIVGKEVLHMTVRLLPDTAQEAPPDTLDQTSDVAVNNKQSSAEQCPPAAEVQTEAKGRDDDTEDEELCSASAVLGNTESVSQEFLEMLVENIVRDSDPPDCESFTLELIPGISSAVITFKNRKGSTNFMTRCPQNRTFTNKGFSVRPLEVTEQVLVEDIQDLSKDVLCLYFEKEGGDVESVELNETEQSAIVTFKNPQVVQKIVKMKNHHIIQKEIRAYPFYKSLGSALYGKDKPVLKLPAAVSEPIDDTVWRYLNASPSAAESVHSDMAKHFCKVNLNQPAVCLSPLPSLLQQTNAKAMIKEWSDTVKVAFAQALSKFKPLKFKLESVAWEESEEKIRQMLQNEDVVLVPDKSTGDLSVVGCVEDVNKLEQTLSDVLNLTFKKVHREKLSKTQEIKVSELIFHILCQDGLRDRLLSVYPEIKMSVKKGSLTVTGLNDELFQVNKVIYDAMFALKRQNLEMDTFVLDFLKAGALEELTDALLISNGINAAFEMNADKLQLLAVSDRDLKDAEDHLKRLLISHYIDVEDSNVLKKPEWQHLVSQSEDANNEPYRKIQIHTTGQQVVVSGHKDNVLTVSSELADFLTQNAQVEETIVVKPNAKVEYIKRDKSCLEEVEDKVEVFYRNEAICLSGSRIDVTHCKALVEDLVSSLYFDSLKVAKPGAKTVFQDKESMCVQSLWKETGCLVQLIDEKSGGRDDLAFSQVPKPAYQLQTPDGVEIAVCKADLCSYPVCAIISSSTEDLKHSGGLAQALLNAAGPELQDECNKIINVRGQLKPGDCVITDAGGRLCCKKVIHAVGPKFNPIKGQKVQAQLKKVVKESLELAEKHGCTSVAMPIISRNKGFSLNSCAAAITKAVKEHCDERDDGILKKIHLVNNDDGAVQAMEAAVRQEFGNSGVSQPALQSSAVKSSLGKHATSSSSDQNCLGQVQTKEGLNITLMKGNIEDATTEVTVNTVFEDLNLTKGAVSCAIFKAAGPKLQQLVNAKQPGGTVGEIIATDGCNLKSKQVFHAVAPHWDKGQGIAEKVLSGIFKDCLDKAEDMGLTSISFPAIGTGNLSFPRALVASLMFDEMLAFSSKKLPKHLKKAVIILYSGDLQTIQVFSDEFKKRFPHATGGLVSTASSQSSGPFAKVVSTSGMHETKMGSATIQVVTGDITKETSDVIVNSSNEDFSLKSGVSKAILDAAGQAVESECQTLSAQPHPGMIMTQPGNLKCKKILHLAGQTDPIKINKVVKDALQMCVKDSYTSVSFPAIGTGQGNVQARQVADAMLDAVIDVLSQYPLSPLKTIRIVIFQPHMLTEFYNSMHHREATDPKDKSGFFMRMGSKLKSLSALFIGESANQPQKDDEFTIEPLKVDPACFHICGNSQAQVNSAKQLINDLISKEQDTFSLSDSAILSLTDADRRRIVDIQKTMGVTIRADNKKAPATITIEGLTKDVLRATNEVTEMVKNARDKKALKQKVELASTMVDWQYQQQGFQFQSFDLMTNYELEQAYKKNLPTVNVTVQGQSYTVNMPSGPATDSTGCTLQIKRIDRLKDEDIPEHWDPMPPNAASLAIPITAGTSEHNEVLTLFQASCNRTVTKIERIQNPTMWRSLQIKKRDMEQRNGHQNNMRRLFHGTCHATVNVINDQGFNRSYAGQNAACYGNGTYFAVNANYSARDTYSKPNSNGEKCMYLCQVLTGDYTVGQQHMIVPPARSSTSVQKYDSVVDNTANPTMFVVFHDTQAYPEYLITFT